MSTVPTPASAEHFLALLTRVRDQRIACGELAEHRRNDVRAVKTAYAELGYLRRLAAAGRHGGTAVTSMRQLVAGLAALHPAWRVDGDGFTVRDRHHSAVRRRLRDLEAMGLIRWRIGVDEEGEERRTEITLLPAPNVSADELQAATTVLARWQARYGPALNTGSRTGIHNAARHGRPLSVSERQRRGCRHTRRAATGTESRLRGPKTNSAPPFGASPTAQNNGHSQSYKPHSSMNASQRTGVTRTSLTLNSTVRAALDEPGQDETAAVKKAGRVVGGPSASENGSLEPCEASGAPAWDPEALLARVRRREAERGPVLRAIAEQAQQRAVEASGWTLARHWPAGRLREGWVVARWGASAAAQGGTSAAGPLGGEDYARLRRAVARYERNRDARPDGYPAGGVAALFHIGTLAASGELHNGPRLIAYAITGLDQLSRRMRAIATADSVQRLDAAAGRAQRRRTPSRAPAIAFRAKRWPAWLLGSGRTEPAFDRGRLIIDEQRAELAPQVNTDHYRIVIRDAYLLAGLAPPVEVDGRAQMAGRHQGRLDPAHRPAPASVEELELRELSHRTGEPISQLRRVSPVLRQALLEQARRQEAERTRAEAIRLRDQLRKL